MTDLQAPFQSPGYQASIDRPRLGCPTADHALELEGNRMNLMAKWGLLSRAERDAACNNSAYVADNPVLNAAREVASSVFRATIGMHLDLRYGEKERNPGVFSRLPIPTRPASCSSMAATGSATARSSSAT